MDTKKKIVRFQYSEKDLEDACEAIVSKKLSLNKAHKQYNIPKSTLHTKCTQKVPMHRKLGPYTQLTAIEEEKLAEWIIKKAKSGFPMHPSELQSTVKKYLDANNRKSNFVDNKPGRKWLQLFLGRHPEISKRNAEIISRARASVTELSLRKWFEELTNFVSENEAGDIFAHPERIFNADETGVQMCPKLGALLTPKNFKNSYQIASGKEKEQVTVLCNISANGEAAPPMLVYPYKRIPRDIVSSVPDDWGIGRSDSGWMISETFLDYIKKVFHPWLIKKNVKFPVIMFLDGHKSHINKELFEYCSENKILLFCLYPNATHILQPCDVSFFKSLKNAWREAVINYKACNPTKVLSRTNFAGVFEQAYNLTVSKTDVLSNGFRKCGLYPLDPNAVDYTKCVKSSDAPIENSTVVLNKISTLDVESTMKVLKHLTSANDINYFNICFDENKFHEHPFFPIWHFCKSFLSENDVPLIQEQTGLIQNQENTLTDLTHVTEFDEAFGGTSTTMDINLTTGLDIEVLLNNKDLTFEYRDHVSLISVVENDTSSSNTDITSKVIPLPWYEDKIETTTHEIRKSPIGEQTSQYENKIGETTRETCYSPIIDTTTKDNDKMGTTSYHICKSPVTAHATQGIETFLTLPSLSNPTRKRKTTIMPYGITSKKMKAYYEEQDLKKQEKEESIKKKKTLKMEKIKALEAKKKYRESKQANKEEEENKSSKDSQNRHTKALKPKTNLAKKKDTQLDKEYRITNETRILNDKDENEEENKIDEIEVCEAKRAINATKKENDINITNFINESNNFLVDRANIISEARIKFDDITFESYVLVEFKEMKSTKLFVGKVLMINDEEKKLKVDFMRKKNQKKLEAELFVYPQVRDMCEINIDTVVDILVVEKTTRRGEIIFTRGLKNAQ